MILYIGVAKSFDVTVLYRAHVTAELGPRTGEPEPTVCITGSPTVAAVNLVAAHLVDIVGPFSWAALVALYVLAQITPH